MSTTLLQALPLSDLRERSSTKWRKYPDDVLPLFVAEHDFPLAPAITRALLRAVEIGDTGYTPPQPGIREAFVAFAARRQSWSVDPRHVFWTGDVMMGVVEILRRVTSPGDRVVIMPPVYPPFPDTVDEAGAVALEVPLLLRDGSWEIDLEGVEEALAGGARAILLCSPHNPTGTIHARETLVALAEIAATYGATVISDEIHAPMAFDRASFTPFTAVSETAANVGYVVTSASKTFNLAGLKSSVMVAGADASATVLRSMHDEVEWRTGLFGAIANVAAYAPESDAWLDSFVATLDANRALLAELLAEHLPQARYSPPDAGFLTWIDLTEVGWGDNPAAKILKEARIAVNPGASFGREGAGFIRINVGCDPGILRVAIERIGSLATS